MNKKVFFVFIYMLTWFFLLIITSCDNASPKIEQNTSCSVKTQSKKIICSGNTGFVKIENTGSNIVKFRFVINDKFWFSPNDLISYIREMECKTSLSVPCEVFNAAVIMSEFSFHQPPVTLKEQILTNPIIILNSLGFGLCDDRSCALVRIWQQMGYKSRCVHLGGHAVAEVFVNGKWNMFDVDNNIFFTNKQSEIQSVEQIGVLKESLVLRQIVNSYRLSQLYFLLNKTKYFELFSSTYNNGYSDSIPLMTEQSPGFFSLLPGSFIEFRITTTADPISHDNFCRIHIPNHTEGIISIPFVIHHIEGSGLIFNFSNAMISNAHTRPSPPGRYYITSKGMDIYAFVNPTLITISDTLQIKLCSSNCEKLSVNYIISEQDSAVQNFNAFSYEALCPYINYFDNNADKTKAVNIEKIDDLADMSCRLYMDVFSKTCNKEKIALNIIAMKSTLGKMQIPEEKFIENINDRELVTLILILVNQADTSVVMKSIQMMYPAK